MEPESGGQNEQKKPRRRKKKPTEGQTAASSSFQRSDSITRAAKQGFKGQPHSIEHRWSKISQRSKFLFVMRIGAI